MPESKEPKTKAELISLLHEMIGTGAFGKRMLQRTIEILENNEEPDEMMLDLIDSLSKTAKQKEKGYLYFQLIMSALFKLLPS